MTMIPHNVSIDITDKRMPDRRDRWAKVTIHLEDVERDSWPQVDVSVLVPSDLSLSIAELRKRAEDQTKTTLRAVLDLLEMHGIEGLASIVAEREEREANQTGFES